MFSSIPSDYTKEIARKSVSVVWLLGILLVINTNLGPVLHRFGDTAVLWSKNRQNRQFVPIPVSEIAVARVTPIEFRDDPDISRN